MSGIAENVDVDGGIGTRYLACAFYRRTWLVVFRFSFYLFFLSTPRVRVAARWCDVLFTRTTISNLNGDGAVRFVIGRRAGTGVETWSGWREQCDWPERDRSCCLPVWNVCVWLITRRRPKLIIVRNLDDNRNNRVFPSFSSCNFFNYSIIIIAIYYCYHRYCTVHARNIAVYALYIYVCVVCTVYTHFPRSRDVTNIRPFVFPI